MSLKPSDLVRFLGGLAVALVVLGFVILRVTSCSPLRPTTVASTTHLRGPPPKPAPPPAPPTAACDRGPVEAARTNSAGLRSLIWAPFGRLEAGWQTYAPLIAREIHTSCEPGTPGFAAALAAWEAEQRFPPDGTFNTAAFTRMSGVIETRRPFVRLSAQQVCPDPPSENALAAASPEESYGGKTILLRPGALRAYRRMVAAARADEPAIAADPRNLTIFSGYRSPAADAARCAREDNCNGAVRATCSAHRTGLALDLYVGQAPGFPPDSSADANRRFMSQGPSYRWLVANADRFGFVPYPFEPWHWEWTGEAP